VVAGLPATPELGEGGSPAKSRGSPLGEKSKQAKQTFVES